MGDGGWGSDFPSPIPHPPSPAQTASSVCCGIPLCINAIARSTTILSPCVTVRRPSPVNWPITVASTSSLAHSANSAPRLSGGTASTMRSCASESQISQGCSPAYLSGTSSSATRAPVDSPISPTAEESPPAPQSVIALYRPASRAWSSTSSTFFSVIGSPICTALPTSTAVVCVSSADEKVAPWIPSRPVRPPSTTTASPGWRLCGCLPRGASPTVPQNTSGLAV